MTFCTPERVLASTNINIPPPRLQPVGTYNKYGFGPDCNDAATHSYSHAYAYAHSHHPTSADGMSDMSSPPSPARVIVCFCGRTVEDSDGGIYCSVACARSDAFSSLCYKPTPSTISATAVTSTSHPPSSFRFPGGADMRQAPSLASSSTTSASLSRNPSSASNASASSTNDASDGWDASHYRRLARADIRKEERKEERRRRRADLNNRSISSSISSSVPDLVGGHSRNVSTASSVSSAYTVGSLSRNPSTASTASSRRYGNGVNVDEVIMEDEDEAEWLQDGGAARSFTAGPPGAYMPKERRKNSSTAPTLTNGRKKQLEAFGMGKDMRDVLEEILQMEREFVLSDTEENEHLDGDAPPVNQGIFTATFDRPPRTPSPVGVPKRQSRVPIAPGAPIRGHRMSFSHSTAAPPMFLQQGHQTPRRQPPSMISGHQSSLSESHTALYLATASPAAAPSKRSLSPPPLAVRKSLTFTPDKAGPSIGALRPPRFDTQSPGVTPSRRRGKDSPSVHHPTMDGWKFPSSTSNAATPTRPPPINTTNLPGNFSTPVAPRHHGDIVVQQPMDSISPQLLWPATTLPPPLAPALFPSSPAMYTPEMLSGRSRVGAGVPLPPYSGITLGELMGSGDDVEMGEDNDAASSTAHGHGDASDTAYLPVYLEGGEGFRRMRWE